MPKTYIPDEFRQKYSALLGRDFDEFLRFSGIKIPKSIWANSLKMPPDMLEKRLSEKGIQLKPLQFHENAFEIAGLARPGSLPEFEQGLFNVQEKASMLPAIALNPEGCGKVLDMCAAPGNKTIQLATLMQSRGKILAIDKNVERFRSLNFNMKKFGLPKIVKTVRANALELDKKNYFDACLLDAPCSSEGIIRKKADALKNWSQQLVEQKAALQKKLILKAFDSISKDDALVYSTCSLSPEENEEVIKHLMQKRKLVLGNVKFKGFKLRNGIEGIGHRVLPQDNDSQAFYLCKIRKL